ncbi:MAG TPA: proline dehydrogenase family protein, partial [Burkholderiaceae bacterium]|nr:proline dehydrogenase family protein [Burkholderiaceae bacterium]
MDEPLARLNLPVRDEAQCAHALRAAVLPYVDWPRVMNTARPWIEAVRAQPAPFWAMESLLKEYPISSAEGLALMRLAESLLRVPDTATAMRLTADQLSRADFEAHDDRAHPWFANVSAAAIALSKRVLPGDESAGSPSLWQRLGARTVVGAAVRAVQLLGRQFVFGETIESAGDRAARMREHAASLRFSFDMLGEGARTAADAQRYHYSYLHAIEHANTRAQGVPTYEADGVSIKLSALHPRYEEAQRERVMTELVPRVIALADAAARGGIPLTIDAEESDRLELSLDVFEAVLREAVRQHPHWHGLGLAVQAYQTRAIDVVNTVVQLATTHNTRVMMRLVKGAYWDAEIKRAQERGLSSYPVFTRKVSTDVSYLACAERLFSHRDAIYP